MKTKDQLIPDEVITAWVTKYALTYGIQQITARVVSGKMIADNDKQWSYYHGNDWHLTEREARMRAEEMRLKKMDTLTKQLARLKKMVFV